MGGWGIYDFLKKAPTLFAAAVPVAGGGKPDIAASIKDVPLWIWHGDKDEDVKPEHATKMAEALKAAGSTVFKYTLLPGEGHLIHWKVADNADVREWIFAQARK